MEVELVDIVSTVVGDGMGELAEGNDCMLRERNFLCLDGG